MSTLDKISKILKWNNQSLTNTNSKLFTFDKPLLSSYGKDIFVSDIVKTAVHRIAEEVSKCELKSIVIKTNPVRKVVVSDNELNSIFNSRMNELMSLKDFLYKLTFLLIKNSNCFIYPLYEDISINNTKYKRVYKGFYIIESSEVLLYNNGNEMRVEFKNENIALDLPYSDIIHLRYKYSDNSFFGSNINGVSDVRELLGNLQVIHTIKECIPKALESSLSLKGILQIKTIAMADKKIASREEFENHLFDSKYGIIATDYESEFKPININPTDIPSNILNFLHQEILHPFGVSLPILIGKYNDDEFTSFYQTAIEGILISISQCFTNSLFSSRELALGHRIKVYDRLVQNLSFEKRMKIVDITLPSGLLHRDEARELLGYEPDDEEDRVSLNWIAKSITSDYQLNEIKNKKEGKHDQTNRI